MCRRKLNVGKPFGRPRWAREWNLFEARFVMRATILFTVTVALLCGVGAAAQPTPSEGKKDDKKDVKKDDKAPEAGKLTAAAELTLTKALKVKLSMSVTGARLGDVLKELAAQADAKADLPLLWTYGPDFPFAQKVTYACKDKPIDVILDELFKKNGGLGYVVISKEGDKRDGWVLLTVNGERGLEKPEPKLTDAEESEAADKLALAKKLIGANKTEQAKTVLAYITKKYPKAKVTAEAKELLAKLEK